MTYPDISRDPPRDPRIAAWLAGANVEPVEADAAGLYAAIMARAQLPLARLRRPPQWWEYMASWSRPALPVAIAAGLALAFLVGSLPVPGPGPAPMLAAESLPPLEDVLTYSVPDDEYNLLMAGAGDTDPLLSFTMNESR
jgi:hypothetical protein